MTVRIMSDKELARLKVLRDLDGQRLTAQAAADILDLSRRQALRLLKAYRTSGVDGLIPGKIPLAPVAVTLCPARNGVSPMPAIGYVTKQNDGTFKGQLKTLSITASLEIVKNASKKATDNQPDYRVVANKVEIGAAWVKKAQGSGNEYVSLSLAAPEFGRRKLYANLGKAAGQDDADLFAIIWNPIED